MLDTTILHAPAIRTDQDPVKDALDGHVGHDRNTVPRANDDDDLGDAPRLGSDSCAGSPDLAEISSNHTLCHHATRATPMYAPSNKTVDHMYRHGLWLAVHVFVVTAVVLLILYALPASFKTEWNLGVADRDTAGQVPRSSCECICDSPLPQASLWTPTAIWHHVVTTLAQGNHKSVWDLFPFFYAK
ncbi:hypothetical protein TW95_gp0392 [Pandoravirus inopinatum]|uniref:Uncharacterized protein n=1 Tax=Pandoravirus inopinatum TaxID=1605721 RepID=A0A0B5J8L2_9VIRU|nr:hypothetical protein TW95_gp0392 [Pandoravirus inopinatum]AJF97126.1 hypothetical protein [Pandoravirus inopinatum]